MAVLLTADILQETQPGILPAVVHSVENGSTHAQVPHSLHKPVIVRTQLGYEACLTTTQNHYSGTGTYTQGDKIHSEKKRNRERTFIYCCKRRGTPVGKGQDTRKQWLQPYTL